MPLELNEAEFWESLQNTRSFHPAPWRVESYGFDFADGGYRVVDAAGAVIDYGMSLNTARLVAYLGQLSSYPTTDIWGC